MKKKISIPIFNIKFEVYYYYINLIHNIKTYENCVPNP